MYKQKYKCTFAYAYYNKVFLHCVCLTDQGKDSGRSVSRKIPAEFPYYVTNLSFMAPIDPFPLSSQKYR